MKVIIEQLKKIKIFSFKIRLTTVYFYHSERWRPLGFDEAPLDLFRLSLLEPSLDFVYFLLSFPILELFFREVQNLPVLVPHELGGQQFQIIWLAGHGVALFAHVVLYGDLLLPENVVEIEKVVLGHQHDGVNEALLVQEGLHVEILAVLGSQIVYLDLIEVPFSVVEFVEVLPGIHLIIFEVVLQVKFGELERFVVNDRQHVILCNS